MRGRTLIVLAALLAALLGWNYLRPAPAVAASLSLPAEAAIAGSPPTLPWPALGSAAVGISGLGFIASSGNEQALPTASVAKVMTALVIIADKPLAGEGGATLTMTDQDVQTYQADKADQQSVVEVRAGERLSEFQALEAMLIPSGNNIAETLARWDAGSIPAFVVRMNKRAKDLGMAKTKFADPAGLSTESVSTPSDLVSLGVAAMRQPVIAAIVKLPQAQIPVAGVVYNVDYVLGRDGIIGIKTGSGLNLGANFLFAAAITVSGRPVTLFGCVMGQPTLAAAFSAAEALITAMAPAVTIKQVLAKHQAVGGYDSAWGEHADVVSTVDVNLVEWPGMTLRERLDAPALAVDKPVPPDSPAGTLHIDLGDYKLDVPLVTASSLYPAGRLWRVTRLPWSNS
jgi:serine-type D-Ala-D-Ala carboxypeptidase (penicillin-binding protein 5/6)